MKAQEVHKMNVDELEAETRRLERRLYDLRCQAVTEKIENPSEFRKIRADIARLKTEHTARSRRAGAR